MSNNQILDIFVPKPGDKVDTSPSPTGKNSGWKTREQDPLSRRIKPSGVLKFFDLGWVKQGGVYATLPRFPRTFTIFDLPHPYDSTDMVTQAVGLGLENCYDYDKTIDTFSDQNPETTGFLARVNITVVAGDNTYFIYDSLRPHGSPDYKNVWTSDGLKLPAAAYNGDIGIFMVHYEGTAEFYAISGTGHQKTTMSNDYSAPAVDFKLQPDDEIFIAPHIMDYKVFGDHFGSPANIRVQAIGRIIIVPGALMYMRDSPYFGRNLQDIWGFDTDIWQGAIAYKNAYDAVTNGYPGLDSSSIVSNHTLWPVPTGSNVPPSIGFGTAYHLEGALTYQPLFFPNRVTIIIKRGSTIFYQFADE